MSDFPFVQIELAGAFGIDPGRYPVRSPGADGAPEEVLVVRVDSAPVSRRRFRRPKPRDADPETEATVPVTELTVISATAIDGDPEAWLEEMKRDEEARAALVDSGLATVARALGARRVAAVDAGIPEPSLALTLALRVGWGEGEGLVEGRWGGAIETPRESTRLGRASRLRPQERMAAILGGREEALACEELILRAGADVNAGRMREAALGLRVGLEAMLAEREAFSSAAQADDLALIDGRRRATGAAANEALKGPLSAERAAEVADTLGVCARILRRRAAQG